jgi:antitoxin PrlF
MYKAKMTSKGQITIPVGVRKSLGLKPGEKVAFSEGENGGFILRRVGSIMDLRGILAGFDVPKTDEEMNEAIAEAVTESYLRSVGRLPAGDSVSDPKDEAA